MNAPGWLIASIGMACSDISVNPPASETLDPTLDCRSFDASGDARSLTFDEATLTVPAGAVDPGVEVTLCVRDADRPDVVGRIWAIGPSDLRLFDSLTFEIRPDEVTGDERMMIPGATGPRPALEALEADAPDWAADPQVVTAPLHRPGEAWVVRDARRVSRYPSPDLDILFVLDHTGCNHDNHVSIAQAYAAMVHEDLRTNRIGARVAVTTSDMTTSSSIHQGALFDMGGNAYLTPEDAAQSLIDAMTFYPNATGSTPVFEATMAALDRTENRSVFRPGAERAIVISTDFPNVPATPTLDAFLSAMGADATVHVFTNPVQDFTGVLRDAASRTGGIVHDWANGEQAAVEASMATMAETWATTGQQLALPLAADPTTLEAWWVPFDREPERIADEDVSYLSGGFEVVVTLRNRPHEEVIVLWEPANR